MRIILKLCNVDLYCHGKAILILGRVEQTERREEIGILLYQTAIA